MQRECLRRLWALGSQDAVARELNLSTETVKSHLASARTRLGVGRSIEAARLLAEAEGATAPPSGVTLRWGMPAFGHDPSFPPVQTPTASEPAQLREEARPFPETAFEARPRWPRSRRRDALTLRERLPATLVEIVLAAVVIVLITFVILAIGYTLKNVGPEFFRALNRISFS